MDRTRMILSASFGCLVGLIAFGHKQPSLLAFSAILPLFWVMSRDKKSMFVFALCYYLAAARGVPEGAAVFFGGAPSARACGLLLWLSSSLALALPWSLIMASHSSSVKTFIRLLAIFVFITLPPLGLFGWASPLLAAAFIFPRTGWWGLTGFLILFSCLTLLGGKKQGVSFLIFLIMLTVAVVWPNKIVAPEGFASIDTSYGKAASGSAVFTDGFIRSTDIFKQVIKLDLPRYLLLPETLAGTYNMASKELWGPLGAFAANRGQTIILGGEIYDKQLKYDNCMIFLGADGGQIYKQRVPVPFSMWRPMGGAGTANAYIFDNGKIKIADGRTAICLICYEQYLAWPVLRSMLSLSPRPEILIASANQWWSRETCIPKIQEQSVFAWAMLFNLKCVTSTNK